MSKTMSRIQATRFNLSCAICYENYAEGDVQASPEACGHVFHKACLDKWLEQKKECPTCRGSVTSATPGTTVTDATAPIPHPHRTTVTDTTATIPRLPRTTPNIYKELPLMETLQLYNIIQSLIKPVEYNKHSYQIAYPDIIECIVETFKVSTGQETVNELIIKLTNIPRNKTHRDAILSVVGDLYSALIRYIPSMNFDKNPLVLDNYKAVCKIPIIRMFRRKYK